MRAAVVYLTKNRTVYIYIRPRREFFVLHSAVVGSPKKKKKKIIIAMHFLRVDI